MESGTTITNSSRITTSSKKVEEELSITQIVEKIHCFLECCQTELSPLTRVPISSMKSNSSNNEDVDDSEQMTSVAKDLAEDDGDNDSGGSPYYLTLFLKILKRVNI